MLPAMAVNATPNARPQRRALAFLAALLLALLACRQQRTPAEPAKPVQAAATKGPGRSPPQASFTPAKPWRSSKDPETSVSPPDPASETWRAFVNQHTPNQRLTPKWQPLPASETVELSMPEGSLFRCVVQPLQTTAQTNDFNTQLIAWSMQREVLCSSDQWQTWTSATHEVRVPSEGERVAKLASLHLREVQKDGASYHTVVLLRDDEEQRDGVPGPPRILENVVVDDD
jgi:hypothetical protein